MPELSQVALNEEGVHAGDSSKRQYLTVVMWSCHLATRMRLVSERRWKEFKGHSWLIYVVQVSLP